MIMLHKKEKYDHWEFSGEFKDGKFWNGDELKRHQNGKMILYVYKEGERLIKVIGKEGSDEEEIINLKA